MNKYTFILALIVLKLAVGCRLNPGPTAQSEAIFFPTNVGDTIVYVKSETFFLPAVINIPECSKFPAPTVIILHGSGGMWDDNIPGGELSRQMAAWRDIWNNECVISVFIDSYSPRGVVENKGEYKDPPKTFEISSQFERPKDAYDVLQYLWTIKTESGDKFIVKKSRVGLMGFSHGATAVESALFDPVLLPLNWTWTQKFNGTTYDVFQPFPRPEVLTFMAAVAYYPGSFHNGYFGDICDETESVYMNYSPLLMHLAGSDPLTSNSLCLVGSTKLNGGQIDYLFYDYAEHGFDDEMEGINGEANIAAKNATLDWFRKYLEF